jgi:glycosyltransferase involved in cell wall biosynthesis
MIANKRFFISYPHSNHDEIFVYGWSEYSYRYLAESVLQALQDLNYQVEVVHSEEKLNYKLKKLKGIENPIHIAIGPPNCCFASPLCMNFIIFAWEFPDIPNRQIGGEFKNNWVKQLQFFDEIYTLSDFATSVVRHHYPENSFTLPVNFLQSAKNLKNKSFVEKEVRILSVTDPLFNGEVETSLKPLNLGLLRSIYRNNLKRLVPKFLHKIMVVLFRSILDFRKYFRTPQPKVPNIGTTSIRQFSKGNTVISSWLNPFDSRKNFILLLDVVAHTISINPQIRLLLKLHCSQDSGLKFIADSIDLVARKYKISPSSIGFVFEYLNQDESHTFRHYTNVYLNTSSGEGLCWPVLEHLASGIPAVIPNNTVFLEFTNLEGILRFECDRMPTSFPFNSTSNFDTYTFPPIRKSLDEALAAGTKVSVQSNGGAVNFFGINHFLNLTLIGGVLFELH